MAALDSGSVLVGGRRASLVGSPSLEHARVDLSSHVAAAAGDEVVIIGTQRAERITIGEVLQRHPEMSETAIALAVGRSVRRLYSNHEAGRVG